MLPPMLPLLWYSVGLVAARGATPDHDRPAALALPGQTTIVMHWSWYVPLPPGHQ